VSDIHHSSAREARAEPASGKVRVRALREIQFGKRTVEVGEALDLPRWQARQLERTGDVQRV